MVDGGNTYTELATPLSSTMDDEANKFQPFARYVQIILQPL